MRVGIFFVIAIRLIAVYLLIVAVMSYVPTLPFHIAFNRDRDAEFLFASIVGLILSIGVPLIIILNADRIVALLRLEKNFGPDFTINLPSEHTLLKIGVIFIGGITIINYVPDVISNIFLLLKYGLPGAGEKTPRSPYAGFNNIIRFQSPPRHRRNHQLRPHQCLVSS